MGKPFKILRGGKFFTVSHTIGNATFYSAIQDQTQNAFAAPFSFNFLFRCFFNCRTANTTWKTISLVISRVMAMFTVAIAIQYILEGEKWHLK